MNDKYEKLNNHSISYYKSTDIQLIENVEINDSLQLLLLHRAWQTEIKITVSIAYRPMFLNGQNLF